MYNLDQEFVMDVELESYIVSVYDDNAYKVFNIFNHLAGLNAIYHNRDKIFLEKLEHKLLTIIATTTTVEDTKDLIDNYIIGSIKAYLQHYHIFITPDATLYQLEDLLDSILTLYMLDLPSTDEAVEAIADDLLDNKEKLTYLLSLYSTYNDIDVFDILLQVDDELFDHLLGYFKAKLHRGAEQLNEVDILKVRPLVEVDPKFSSTRVVRDILYYGYHAYTFDQYLDTLYSTIGTYNDHTSIAFEIVATNYLSKDRPISSEDDLLKIINFQALDHIDYDYALNEIVPLVLDLMLKIK